MHTGEQCKKFQSAHLTNICIAELHSHIHSSILIVGRREREMVWVVEAAVSQWPQHPARPPYYTGLV